VAADLEVFDSRVCVLGEGPSYDDLTGRAAWVDIVGRRLLWRTVATGGVGPDDVGETGELGVPGDLGAAVPRLDGGYVLCLPEGPVLADAGGDLHPLGTFAQAYAGSGREAPSLSMRSNDAKADPAGRLFLGTMAYDETTAAGVLYRLDPGATVAVPVLNSVTVSNGLGWSPEADLMYFIDSPTRRVDVFDYDARTGEISGRRPFVDIDGGFPDGMCVDAAGGVWVAIWGGAAVRRFTPEGKLDRVVELPTPQVTSCAFIGDAYDRLLITTAARDLPAGSPGAGLTYVYTPRDVMGSPAARFAG
jgi:sugar lactone lactonase YvrE